MILGRAISVVLVALAGSLSVCMGQTAGWVRGTVADSLTLEQIPGAVVEILDTSGATASYELTAEDGSFLFGDVVQGEHILKVSILGYRTRTVAFGKGPAGVDLGKILLSGEAIMLESAVHSDQAIRSSQSGDTLSYNAAAYKVMTGADSESLISKMPGISVNDSGVEANGRDVRKVMIDGQEYFGDDVLTALKNIPADMIRQIEVINKLSDQAELTGVDDGNSYTAINIVTRPEARDGALAGRMYGGYGLPDKYIAGANLNYFGKEQSASLLAMGNNISRYNFASEDIVGASAVSDVGSDKSFKVKPLPGISSVQSAGANYSNKWFSGSYFFSRIRNRNESFNDKMTYLGGDRKQFTDSRSDFNALNYNHRFTSKISLSPAPAHSLIIRPVLDIQDLGDGREQRSHQENLLSDGSAKFLREKLNINNNDRFAVRAGGSLSYRYRFPKRGRTLVISASGNYYKNNYDNTSDQYTFRTESGLFDPEEADNYSSQYRDRLTEQLYGSGGVTYTDRIGKRSRLNAEYRFSANRSYGENIVRLLDKALGDYSPEPDSRQSSINSSRFITHTAGLRYNYAFRKISLTVFGGYQNTGFRGVYTMPSGGESRRGFSNFIYNVVANVPFDQENSLRLDARSRTVNPSVNTLQSVVNLANTSNIRAGNPDVDPSYIHEVGLRYIHTDRDAGSTLSVSLNYTGSSNYLCDSLVIDSPDFEVADGVLLGEGNQYVKPVNLGGYSKFYGKMTFGFPLKPLRCNMNLTSAVTLSSLPGMINADKVPVHRNWYSLGARIDSNISENLDFSVGYSGRFTQNEYSGRFGKVNNNFLTQDATAKVKWVFWLGFSVTAATNYRQYRSIDGRYNDELVLCDLYVGKRLFRDGLGEVSIGVNDILDQGTHRYSHSISASGTSDTVNSGTGRYFSVQFVYHLRAYSGRR